MNNTNQDNYQYPYQQENTYSQYPNGDANYVPAEPYVEAEPVNKQKGKTDILGIISLVVGILGIIFNCCCYYVAPVLAIAAIILALVSPKDEYGKRAGLAKAGLICGIVAMVMFIVTIVLTIVFPTALTLFTGLFAGLTESMAY